MDTKIINRLSKLKVGQGGSVVKIEAQGLVRRRILEMGVTLGTEVVVTGTAPLGDPIEITVKGYHLSLRKEEAASIWVEAIKK